MTTKYKTAYPFPTEKAGEYIHYTFERGTKDCYLLDEKGVVFTDPVAYTKAVEKFYKLQPGDIVHMPEIFNSPAIVVERLDRPVLKAVLVLEYEYEEGRRVYSIDEIYIPISVFLALYPGAEIVTNEEAEKISDYIRKVDYEELMKRKGREEGKVGDDFISSVIAHITQPRDSF